MKLEAEPDDKQMSSVWKISVSPMASGCCRRVNRNEVLIKRKESKIRSVISESSLMKILVLGINDRVKSFFLTL